MTSLGFTIELVQKWWTGRGVFAEWLPEELIFKPLPNWRTRVLLLGNCSANKILAELWMYYLKICLCWYFPASAPELSHPADEIVIPQIKSECRSLWDEKVMEMINSKMWTVLRSDSGRLINPLKLYFYSYLQMCCATLYSKWMQMGFYSLKSRS